MLKETYYEVFDGWFTFYVNTQTGEKVFELDTNDILVEQKLDDFERQFGF